jgi:hypothetical protein
MEELEAVDWYNQRADACKDKELEARQHLYPLWRLLRRISRVICPS